MFMFINQFMSNSNKFCYERSMKDMANTKTAKMLIMGELLTKLDTIGWKSYSMISMVGKLFTEEIPIKINSILLQPL